MASSKQLLLAATAIFGLTATQALADDVMYISPNFGWSLKFPREWRVDASDAAVVSIRPPDGSGLCSVHFNAVRFQSVDMFADVMLDVEAKLLQQRKRLKSVTLSRKQSTLPSGQASVEAVVDLQPGGRSHRLYVLWQEVPGGRVAYTMDCETTIQNWDQLEKAYNAIMASFAVGDPNATATARVH